MPDDALLWTHQPSRLVRQPRPGERLWEFRQNPHTYSCELRYHGEYGVEAQILKDGELLIGHRRITRALAVEWAAEMRKDLEADGNR